MQLRDSVHTWIQFLFSADEVRPKTHCEHHRDSVQTISPEGYPILGAYVPQCDTNGQYTPLQVGVNWLKIRWTKAKKIMNVCSSSVTVLLDTVGVLTVMDRKEREPGLQQEHRPQTVTNRVQKHTTKQKDFCSCSPFRALYNWVTYSIAASSCGSLKYFALTDHLEAISKSNVSLKSHTKQILKQCYFNNSMAHLAC